MLAVFVNPTFALRSLPRFMGLLAALDPVELVLRSVYLVVVVKFELGADVHRDYVFDLLLDARAFRDQLTLEHSVDAQTLVSAD